MGNNLGLHKLGYKLIWAGMSGMSVYDVVPIVQNMIHLYGLPHAVLIHCGGNDVGKVNCAKLLFDIKFMLYVVGRMIYGRRVIFSSILPRLEWRHSDNAKAMDVTRKRINRGVKSYLNKTGGYTIIHEDFENKPESFICSDGVHLTYIGNDLFLNSLQSALEYFHFMPYNTVFPIQE